MARAKSRTTGRSGRIRRSSIADVAAAAEVSVGTVSNVLNRPERVLPHTRDRVLAAIERLQFVPNGSARQLRAGTITTVGVIVQDIANPFFTEVIRGVEDRLSEAGYTLMLASSDEDPDREARYLRLFEEHGVFGLLVVPSGQDLTALRQVIGRGTRVVLLDRSDPELPSAAVDDTLGGSLAIEHLLSLGHRSIAVINGRHDIEQCAERWSGAVAAVTAAGLEVDEILAEHVVDALNAAGGSAGARRAWRSDNRPTALFCVNDVTALGAMRWLRENGVRVPADIAVVGYDDVAFAAELAVPLTSVRQPTHRLGYAAADLLLSDEVGQVRFAPELVVRESSAPVS